jgi:hypothetical protein
MWTRLKGLVVGPWVWANNAPVGAAILISAIIIGICILLLDQYVVVNHR